MSLHLRAGLLAVAVLVAAGHASAQSPAPAQTLLTQSDVQYIGSCVLPANLETGARTTAVSMGSGAPGYVANEGLAAAYIGGTQYLFSTADGRTVMGGTSQVEGEPYRFRCTNFSTTAPFPVASIIESYGDAYSCRRVDVHDNCDNSAFRGPGGLYVRSVAGSYELWWTYPPEVYANDGAYACLGYSKLNIGQASAVGVAAYKFQDLNYPLCMGSFFPIPAAWQSKFGGHTMMLANKGIGSNHGSIDPYISVTDFPTGAHLSTVPSTAFRAVMGFGFTQCAPTSSMAPSVRLQRPSWIPPVKYNYSNDAYQPTPCVPADTSWASPAYLQHSNVLDGADQFLFVDTGTKYGVLAFNHWTLGGVSYTAASVQIGGATTGMSVIDPDVLAKVYAGAQSPSSVTYASEWPVHYPGFDYAAYPFQVAEQQATIKANGTTNRWRLTLTSPWPWLTEGEKVNTYGGMNLGFFVAPGGVISPTEFDLCAGQNCNYDIPTDGPVTPTMAQYASYWWNGKVVGAVWMPTHSACGVDNSFAITVDAPDGAGGLARYVHCYAVRAGAQPAPVPPPAVTVPCVLPASTPLVHGAGCASEIGR